MSSTRLIAIDWGTSAARAYWLGENGMILRERAAPLGVQKIADGKFAEALQALLGEPAPADMPIIACGMIGSRQGWVEVPYRECPADFTAIANALTPVEGTRMSIVPGLICRDKRGIPDVMRGEETKIAGAFPETFTGRRVVVMPGTHSKWALVAADRVECFASFMTGEIYAVLREHSILGRLASDGRSPGAFERGVTHSLRDDAMPTHDLFSARTLALAGELATEGVADYLSGLLIGAEISGARRWLAESSSRASAVTLLGDTALIDRYASALRIAGIETTVGPEDAVVRGLWRIAQSMQRT